MKPQIFLLENLPCIKLLSLLSVQTERHQMHLVKWLSFNSTHREVGDLWGRPTASHK